MTAGNCTGKDKGLRMDMTAPKVIPAPWEIDPEMVVPAAKRMKGWIDLQAEGLFGDRRDLDRERETKHGKS